MKKPTLAEKNQLKELAGRVKQLQKELVTAKQVEGIDEYLAVRVGGTKLRFSRTKVAEGPDKAVGEFRFVLELTAKQVPLYVPLSIASGKTVVGFMYQIEGTGESSVASASVAVQTRGLTQISVGTLRYLVVPKSKTAELELVVTVRGKVGKHYRIVVNRLNYKLTISDARYQQYLKPLGSKSMRFV
ncbi:MAG: hypothetical protein ACK4SL_01710 [Candidatus Paceibacteria bacterium]